MANAPDSAPIRLGQDKAGEPLTTLLSTYIEQCFKLRRPDVSGSGRRAPARAWSLDSTVRHCCLGPAKLAII